MPPYSKAVNERETRFVEEYLIDGNAAAAYVRAGYAARHADINATNLMKRPGVIAALAAARTARSERTQITADMVLERWWAIATADPNEIVEYRRDCCRYCHGKDHAYQWKDHFEFAEASQKKRKVSVPEPTDEGGYGFDAKAPTDPTCPRCNGQGYGRAFIHDTRKLTGPARLLYAGVKETRDGLEVKMGDQAKALENVARHLGMFTDRVLHSGKIEVESLSDADLAAKIAAYEQGSPTDGAAT